MSEPRRITSEDLALFAMQLLSPNERAEIDAYLERSAEARRELAEIQGDLALYAHTVDLHSPAPQARERLLKQVAREKRATPIDRAPARSAEQSSEFAPRGTAAAVPISGQGQRPGEVNGASTDRYDNGGLGLRTGAYASASTLTEDDLPKKSAAAKVLPWVGWAIAAGLAVTAADLYHERTTMQGTLTAQAVQLDHLSADAAEVASARRVLEAMMDPTAMRVTLTEKGQPPALPQGRATYVASKGTLIFLANNLQPLQPAKTYELWLIPAGAGQSPIPAGTFRPDERGNASVIMPPLPKGVEAKAFGVTVEDEGGATTPTLPIILVGA